MEPTQVRLTIPDSVDMTRLMGPADGLLRHVESLTPADLTVRGNQVSVCGSPDDVDMVTSLFSRLIRIVERGDVPTTADVDLVVDQIEHKTLPAVELSDDILLTYRGRAIRPKTDGQRHYVDAIRHSTITFGIGPAGTGKTYLA
ncbi:MAG: PhoH family protein, partial [Atopobiaceae bacterium]|nr:PhoH family protein [Atopobiaceae bacterium]